MQARIAEASTTSIAAGTDGVASLLDRLIAGHFDTLLLSDRAALPDPLTDIVTPLANRGVAVWLVVAPDAEGRPCFEPYGAPPLEPWLFCGDAALDPRRNPMSIRLGPVGDTRGLADAWHAAIGGAVADGVTGFVCRDPDRLPAPFWTALISKARTAGSSRWIAWTAGLAPEHVRAAITAGFDGVVGSVAWWDGRARWLLEEHERSAPAATVAVISDPFAPAGQPTRPEGLTPVQRLRVAALIGDALLVAEADWRDCDDETLDKIAEVNRWHASQTGTGGIRHLQIVGGDDRAIGALIVTPHADVRASDTARVALINAQAQSATLAASLVTSTLSGFGDFRDLLAPGKPGTPPLTPCTKLQVEAGEVRLFEARRLPAVQLAIANPRRSAQAGLELPRLAIEAVTPSVERGRFPAKRTAGETVQVEADILIDGHEKLAASLLYRAAGERDWREVAMEPLGNDRFGARFPVQRVGRHEFTIEAWRDAFASYRYELDKKFAAGLDVSLELIEGRRLIEGAAVHARTHERTKKQPDVAKRLEALADALNANPAATPRTPGVDVDRAAMATAVAALLSSQTAADMLRADRREFATRPDTVFPVDAERAAASFASWYELFPRSLGNAPGHEATHHGTFADVIDRLPAVKAMGFDVLYFPPIHPIGRRNRKGRNNSLTALDDDPGSPYAIGSEDGGHDALHPQLGTFEDFQRMREAALEHGLEIALDFAIQCSPDHPWLKDHPGWFAWRPDGSLRYAENPPKKYEDIVNVDFYGDADIERGKGDSPAALWTALRDVVLSWVAQGVRIFRVDNPHTKPLPFWEWMIGEVRARHPDVIFLSEAFTRPKVMYRLAKAGFSQSYTYFTWRETKQEFVDYLTELTGPRSTETLSDPPRDFFRPNFFVNTPDINPVFLQRSGRPGFLIRAALAATLSGLWGVYSGFELCEGTPVPGKEDYLDSEKYQLRAWDWNRPGNIVSEITALNRIRRENPALRTHLNVRFETVDDPNILFFAKSTEDLSNVLLIAINLDPYGVHEATFELPLWRWNRPDDATVEVTDLLDGHRFAWRGKSQRMRLDPGANPYAIWRVSL